MSTRHGPPRHYFCYGLIIVILAVIARSFLESRHSIDVPKPPRSPSVARTHVSVTPAKKVSRRPIPAIGTQENPDTGLEPHSAPIPDPQRKGPGYATASEAKLDKWIEDNWEDWDGADKELRDCVTYSYINGWSWTPEAALSYCLTHFELDEGD